MLAKQEMEQSKDRPSPRSIPVQRVREFEKLVYLVIPDLEFAESLATQIQHFGYRTQIVNNLQKLDHTSYHLSFG